MPANPAIPIVVRFLHDLFTALWIGGLATLMLVVLPAIKGGLGTGPQSKQLTDTIQKRLSVVVYIGIVVLAVTGILLSKRSAAYQGAFSFANRYSALIAIKHILMIAMVAIALLRSLVLGRIATLAEATRQKLKLGLLALNLLLGVAVIALSAASSVLGGRLPTP